MSKSQPAAIFWDMDGTLIDTEPLWGQATYELSELLGRKLSPEKRAATIGGSFAATLNIVADWAGYELQDGDETKYHSWMTSRMASLLEDGVVLNPGIQGVLASLARRGTPMVVTTNTERVLANRCIAAIGRQYFVDTITGDEVENPKPAPDMYLEAAQRVNADPQTCLVFEDSCNGMRAAAAAGCVVLGLANEVPNGVHSFDPQSFIGASALDVDRWFAEAVS